MARLMRCCALHDLSSFGRVSLTLIIPTLSAMGIQVCPVPTAVLSTHSGGYRHYSFTDLTESMEQTMKHWKELALQFECIYSGFLGSPKQCQIVEDTIHQFATDRTLVVVDPVLGDHGAMYSSIDPKMVEPMRRLVRCADLVTPNLTELYLLLDRPFCGNPSYEEIASMLQELAGWGPKKIVLTSAEDALLDANVIFETKHDIHVSRQETSLRIATYIYENGQIQRVSHQWLPVHYPGAGDLYTTLVLGAYLHTSDLLDSVRFADEAIYTALKESAASGEPAYEGVLIESLLSRWMKEPQWVPSWAEGSPGSKPE